MDRREPKYPIRYLSKIAVLSDVYPHFSARQLPSDSVNFRGLPFSRVLCNLGYMLYGCGGAEAKVLDPKFS